MTAGSSETGTRGAEQSSIALMVWGGEGGIVRGFHDQEAAAKHAATVRGVVGRVLVVADHRAEAAG